MRLNLSEIIEVPGSSLDFECELSEDELSYPSIAEFKGKITARGRVLNMAGALSLIAEIEAPMLLICDRCLKQYSSVKHMDVNAPLAARLEDEENPDIFLLDGDSLDVSEVLQTLFILEMEAKSLCSPDCQGLCHKCGSDLNKGPCDCPGDIDPRLAVLSQLLDDK